MTVREFQGWIRVMNAQRQPHRTSPDSWEGHEHDPVWAEMRRARDAAR